MRFGWVCCLVVLSVVIVSCSFWVILCLLVLVWVVCYLVVLMFLGRLRMVWFGWLWIFSCCVLMFRVVGRKFCVVVMLCCGVFSLLMMVCCGL